MPGQSAAAKAGELVAACRRRGQLAGLAEGMRRARPDLPHLAHAPAGSGEQALASEPELERQLARAAGAWAAGGRDERYLFRGAQLEAAREWAESGRMALTEEEQAFLAASQARYQGEPPQARAERETGAARRLRQWVIFLGAALGVAVIAAILLYGQAARSAAGARQAEETAAFHAGLALTRQLEADGAQATAEYYAGMAATNQAEAARAATGEAEARSRADLAATRVAGANETEATAVPNEQQVLAREGEATRQRRLALARSLAAFSRVVDQESGDSRLAGLLAIEAYRINHEEAGEIAWLVDAALRPLLSRDPTSFSSYRLRGHEAAVRAVAFSPDGQMLAGGGDDGTVQLWDLAQPWAGPLVLAGHEGAVRAVAFSPDGATVASGGDDGTVRLWEVARPEVEPVILAGHEDWVFSVAFSPDGQMLAGGSADRTVRLWDLAQPEAEPVVLRGHADWVRSVAFSPDGQMLASGGDDATVRLWDLRQPEAEPAVLRGHEDLVLSVAFSPDGEMVAGGGDDATVRLWHVAQPGAEPAVLRSHEAGVLSVTFSPDGQSLASGSDDQEVRVWTLLDRVVEIGCRVVDRNLTWEEWQRYLPGEPYRQTCPDLPRHPSVPADEGS